MNEAVVEMALSDARRILEQTGSFRMRIGIEGGGSIHWIDVPPSMDLNNSNIRDLIANLSRSIAAEMDSKTVVLVHDSWMGVPTEKHQALGPEARKKAMRGRNIRELERMGLVRRVEALIVSVQTPETATMVHQNYERTTDGGIVWGERNAHTVPQSEFSGRLKMFGEAR